MEEFPDTNIPKFIAKQEKKLREVNTIHLAERIEEKHPFALMLSQTIMLGTSWRYFLDYIRQEYMASEAYSINYMIRTRSLHDEKDDKANWITQWKLSKSWLVARCLIYDIVYFGNKTPFDTWVYRGATFTPDQMKILEGAETLVWPSFTSTTMSLDVARSFAHNAHFVKEGNTPIIFMLMLPAGTPCHGYGWVGGSEGEILLPPNMHVDILYGHLMHRHQDDPDNNPIRTRMIYGIVQEYVISPLTPTTSEYFEEIHSLASHLQDTTFDIDVPKAETIIQRLNNPGTSFPNVISSIQSPKAKAGTHFVGFKADSNGRRPFHWVDQFS